MTGEEYLGNIQTIVLIVQFTGEIYSGNLKTIVKFTGEKYSGNFQIKVQLTVEEIHTFEDGRV